MSTSEDAPLLRVVSGGEPTAEELAALVAAVASRAIEPPGGSRRVSRWADRAQLLRRPLHPGPAGWLASARS